MIVHAPIGKPFKITEPVTVVQLGCVIVPIVGTVGVVAAVQGLAVQVINPDAKHAPTGPDGVTVIITESFGNKPDFV